MKKKALSALMLALVLVMVPTFAFAKKSHTYSNGSSSSSSSSTTTSTVLVPNLDGPAGTSESQTDTKVEVRSNGVMVTTTGATRDFSNTWYRLAINTTTTDGTQISADNNAGVKIGNVHVRFVGGYAEIAGLPEHIVNDIKALNSGKTAAEVFGNTLGTDLTSWKNVGNTRAVILTDETTGLTNTGTEFYLDIDPIDEAGTFAVVYYNNWTGNWCFAPVTVDQTTGLIKVSLPGSCTVQLLQKVQ